MIYHIRWLFFLIRLILYSALGIVRFFTKPGSRIIVPLVAATFAFLTRPSWNKTASGPDWWMYDGLVLVLLLLAAWVYSLLSRGLNVILGTFPMPMRPMAPQRRLKPTVTIIKPAVVRVVVPRLPRRRAEKPPMRPLPNVQSQAAPEEPTPPQPASGQNQTDGTEPKIGSGSTLNL